MMAEEALTPEQAAEALQVATETIRRLIRAGKLPAVKIGRQWRIARSAIDAVLRGEAPGA